MEIKSSNWLFDSLVKLRVSLPILDIAICRGNKLLDLYGSDNDGYIIKKSTKEIKHIKTLLLHFLSMKFPQLDMNAVSKPICYAYLRSDRRILTPGDIRGLVFHQLHGLRFETIVMTIPSIHEVTIIYKVHVFSIGNILKCDVFESEFLTEKASRTEDQKLGDEALRISKILVDATEEESKMFVYDLSFEMVLNLAGKAHLCNIIDVRIKEKRDGLLMQNHLPGNKSNTVIRFHDFAENPQLKLRRSSIIPSLPETFESPKLIHQNSKKQTNSERLGKMIQPESGFQHFMEIVDKTIEKDKRNKEIKEKLDSRQTTQIAQGNYNLTNLERRKSHDELNQNISRSYSEAHLLNKPKVSMDDFRVTKMRQINSPKFDPLYERFFKKPYVTSPRNLKSEITEMTTNLITRFRKERAEKPYKTITPGIMKYNFSDRKLIDFYIHEEKSRIQSKLNSPKNISKPYSASQATFSKTLSEDKDTELCSKHSFSNLPQIPKRDFKEKKPATAKHSERPVVPVKPK